MTPRTPLLRVSPFLPGCYVQLDPDAVDLMPLTRRCLQMVITWYEVIQREALSQYRRRVLEVVGFEPIIAGLGSVSETLASGIEGHCHELRTTGRGQRHRMLTASLQAEERALQQVTSMMAAVLAHVSLADAVDDEQRNTLLDRVAELAGL